MKRLLVSCVASVFGLVIFQGGPASAQYIPPGLPSVGPGNQPMLSPYLNLLNTPGTATSPGLGISPTGTITSGFTTSPAVNYFLGTIPEAQRRLNYNQVQGEIGRLEIGQRVNAGNIDEIEQLVTPLRSTGHPTAFNNTGGYFNTSRVTSRPMPGVIGNRPGYSAPGQTGTRYR
jgi:hypothetical protein